MKEEKAKYFDKASKVLALVDTLQRVEVERGGDRSLIDILFNGKRPYTEEEVKKHQIRINVNWNQGTKILQDANRQVNNATLYTGKFCNLVCCEGPAEKRQEWGEKLTKNFNRILKRKKCGKRHKGIVENRNASVCLHGIGPLMWMKPDDLLPKFIPLGDLLIPTDTDRDLENLSHFAVNLYLTQDEFYRMTNGKHVQKGWNVKLCNAILNSLDDPTGNNRYDLWAEPEKWQENRKQNGCYYDADRVPRVKLVAFFFQSTDDGKWYRRVVMREIPSNIKWEGGEGAGAVKDMFVFTSDTPFADDIERILHVQYGNTSNVPPMKYHSIRGLGQFLYAPIECNNRLTSQFVQHTLDNMQPWLRVENPDDRARQLIIQLQSYGILEKGVGVVPQTERHQIDARLAESAMAQMRQNMSENSSSYVQDINDGTNKEMTKFETQVRVQAVNVAVGGMLQAMYEDSVSYFEELLRRLLMKNPTDKFILEFRKACKKDGIPDQVMKFEYWEVSMERVLGAGDQLLAQEEASALLSQSERYDGPSRRKILKLWTSVTTRNPDLANELVPIAPPESTDGVQEAEDVFATLMLGTPVSMREGIDQNGYIETMISAMAGQIGLFNQGEQFGKLPTLRELNGLNTVAGDIQQHIQLIAQSPDQQQAVRQYMDILGKLMNEVKKLTQHVAEQEKANKPDDGEMMQAQAKAEATMLQAQTKAQTSRMSHQQKVAQSQEKFEQKMIQDQEKHQIKLASQVQQDRLDLAGNVAKTEVEIASQQAKAAAAPKKTENGA